MAEFSKGDRCSIIDNSEGDYFFKDREQFIGKKVEFICSLFGLTNFVTTNVSSADF
jgi:hypothetical protein